MVDFINQHAALGVFDHVHRQHTPAHRLGCFQGHFLQFRCDRAQFPLPAPGRIGYPVGRFAVDRGDDLVTHHHGADIPAGLFNVFLDVEDRVLHRPEHSLVFQDGLGRIPVVHLGQQPPPRTDHRFEHHRVPHLLNGLQGRFGCESHPAVRLWHPVPGQQRRGDEFIAAGLRHGRRVDGRDAPGIEDAAGIQAVGVADASFQDGVVLPPGLGVFEVEMDQPVIQPFVIQAAPLERGKNPFLLHAHT